MVFEKASCLMLSKNSVGQENKIKFYWCGKSTLGCQLPGVFKFAAGNLKNQFKMFLNTQTLTAIALLYQEIYFKSTKNINT